MFINQNPTKCQLGGRPLTKRSSHEYVIVASISSVKPEGALYRRDDAIWFADQTNATIAYSSDERFVIGRRKYQDFFEHTVQTRGNALPIGLSLWFTHIDQNRITPRAI